MINSDAVLEAQDLARFRRHARAGLIMTLIGAAIVIASLVYSGRQLYRVQAERAVLKQQLMDAEREAAELRRRAEAEKIKLTEIQSNVRAARSSFIYVQFGIREFATRDYAGAVGFYDKALAVDPNNPVVHDLRGYSLLRSGDAQGAVEALEKSVALAPDYVWGRYNLALAYGKSGQTEQALQQIRKVIELDSSMKETLRGDGQFRIFRDVAEYKSLIGRS